MKDKKRTLLWLMGPGLVVLAADRAIKGLYLASSHETVKNTGMAFGLLEGNAPFILLFSAALLAVCVFLLRNTRLSGLAPAALSLIAGGAAGNMIDRVAYGYVIDMFPFFDWFVFNAADVGVVAGAVLCGVSLLFRPGDWSGKEA